MKGYWVQTSDPNPRPAGCSRTWVIFTRSTHPERCLQKHNYWPETLIRRAEAAHTAQNAFTGNEWYFFYFIIEIIDSQPAGLSSLDLSVTVQASLLLRNAATCWWHLKTAAGKMSGFFPFRLFDISAKTRPDKTFLCRFSDHTGGARDVTQTGLFPCNSIV